MTLQIKLVESKGQRVLTTMQLANCYGVEARRISENYNANKDKYKEGVHFYCLKGVELREFKSKYGNSVFAQNSPIIYIWTEIGALLHAKSLNTDIAWNVYEELIESYFLSRAPQKTQLDVSVLSTELQMFKQLWDSMAQQEIQNMEIHERQVLLENKILLQEKKINQLNAIVAIEDNTTLRQQLNSAVKACAYAYSVPIPRVWNELFTQVNSSNNINIKARAKNANKKPIDILEELGLLEFSLRIVNGWFNENPDVSNNEMEDAI